MIRNSSTQKQHKSSTGKSEFLPGRILLHVCCAPCSGGIITTLLQEGFDPRIFFYNPNIFPREEYERRKVAIKGFCLKKELAFVDADEDRAHWLNAVQGLEDEPERGKRCSRCFDVRLEKTAQYAAQNGFDLFATTNGIGRWKDLEQVNRSGLQAALPHPGLKFWPRNWRKGGIPQTGANVSREEHFYQQTYCGCEFSLDASQKRKPRSNDQGF